MIDELDFRCEHCGEKTEYDEMQHSLCPLCFDEFVNNNELMFAYAEKHKQEFYAEWCYGVEGDYYPELLALCRSEITRDLKLNKPYAIKYLRDFCSEDISDYIEFCMKTENEGM